MLIAVIVCFAAIALALFLENQSSLQVLSLTAPIEHDPPFLGNYGFIVHSGILAQGGYAYSYVVIDSNSIHSGDSFLALPALNVELRGDGLNDQNLTMSIFYSGSPNTVPWINFTLKIPKLNVDWGFAHYGKGGERSYTSVNNLGNRAELFAQTSVVVDTNSWFEFYYYIGNSSTPAPVLSTGPPS